MKRDSNYITVGGAYDGTNAVDLRVDATTDELLIAIADTSAVGVGTPVTIAKRDENSILAVTTVDTIA